MPRYHASQHVFAEQAFLLYKIVVRKSVLVGSKCCNTRGGPPGSDSMSDLFLFDLVFFSDEQPCRVPHTQLLYGSDVVVPLFLPLLAGTHLEKLYQSIICLGLGRSDGVHTDTSVCVDLMRHGMCLFVGLLCLLQGCIVLEFGFVS